MNPPEIHNLETYINFFADYACPTVLTLGNIKNENLKDHSYKWLLIWL